MIRNTSHRCEHSEQHNYAEHNITLAKPNLRLIFDVAKIWSIARHDDCSKIGVEEVLAIVLERKKRQPLIFEFIVY